MLIIVSMCNALEIDDEECTAILRDYCETHSPAYPILIGKSFITFLIIFVPEMSCQHIDPRFTLRKR